MKKRVVGKVAVLSISLMITSCLFCGCSPKASFDDGEALTILLDETRYLRVNEDSDNVSLKSSDENVVSVDKKGFIRGKNMGTASVYAYVDGRKTDEIEVTVERPDVSGENVYYGKIDTEKQDNICITVNETAGKGEKIYAYAKQDGKIIGEDFTYITGNLEGYFSLKELNIVESGIYEFGFSQMKGENVGFVTDVYATDKYFVYGLTGNDEDITFHNSELNESGLSIMNSVLNHGGMVLTFDVVYDDQQIINRYIDINVISGYSWSVKITEGDGSIASSETTITGDVRVYECPKYTIDLCEYKKFIKKGKVSLVIYAIDDTLKLDKIINYSKTGEAIRFMKAN